MDLSQFIISKEKIKPMKAYLSGAMEFAHDEGASWRNDLTFGSKYTDHEAIDPVIESAKLINDNNAQNYREWKVNEPENMLASFSCVLKMILKL